MAGKRLEVKRQHWDHRHSTSIARCNSDLYKVASGLSRRGCFQDLRRDSAIFLSRLLFTFPASADIDACKAVLSRKVWGIVLPFTRARKSLLSTLSLSANFIAISKAPSEPAHLTRVAKNSCVLLWTAASDRPCIGMYGCPLERR